MKADDPLILESVRRNRRQLIVAAAVTLPFGAFASCAPLWSSEGRGITIAATALGVGCVAVGAYLVWMIARLWTPEASPPVQLLRDRPHDIAWVYVEQMSSQAAGITVAKQYSVKIQLVDGKGINLQVAANRRDDLLELLAQLAPQATFGYSRELARQYKRDPRSLIAVAG